ncbi:hypothetical protein P170DRAFT_445469 [Aspergillus steynii IBT 23096]|uniref:Xylanolytic transcriptional activator regulatory domain-containing protein n=1 Tax=Aspergillus steynii IBT 23096 TaxID=1392250 RepID=A0A2I2GB20_9EURO|nr:uncharacterized protein P170DRAFT_445469 [Aspergillus steynii IBT 23096]PLB50078.1 hypothetical protein P170DRAFT_445469 [Aspergillus steynii IBT 23096]
MARTEVEIPAYDGMAGSNTNSNSISAMGAAVPDVDGVDTRDQFYGQSSIISLLEKYTQASTGQTPQSSKHSRAQQHTPSPATSTPSFAASSAITDTSLLSEDFSLPPRKLADWLLEVYFNNFHLLYPWVDKASFLASYDALWSRQEDTTGEHLPDVGLGGKKCSTAVFHCALNAMFALACELSTMTPREKRITSQTFYQRMKSLTSIDILDSGSLAHVQAFLLVGMYLQCTPYPKKCWNAVGMAYRIAVGLGLHRGRFASDLTGVEQTTRRKVWCACVNMDIMTMGRPAMTAPGDIPLPFLPDDRGGSAVSDEQSQLSHQFFQENMRLVGILGRILSTVYRSSELDAQPETDTTVDFQVIMDIDQALESFESSLHPDLHWKFNDTFNRDSNRTCQRLSNYCATTMNHNGLQPRQSRSPGNSFSNLFLANCASRCVQSACELVESLRRATMADTTGAWWYRVFLLIVNVDLVSAGIVLIIADRSGISFDSTDTGRRETASRECLQILHRMAGVNPSARDYAIVLGGLQQRLLQERAGQPGRDVSCEREGQGPDGPSAPEALGSTDRYVPDECSADHGVEPWNYGFSPLIQNWDSGIQDIMLPAQLFQETGEELLLPTLL